MSYDGGKSVGLTHVRPGKSERVTLSGGLSVGSFRFRILLNQEGLNCSLCLPWVLKGKYNRHLKGILGQPRVPHEAVP